jgi:hypothetical protein
MSGEIRMRIFFIALNCLLLTACFTTRLEAPEGKDVRIMAAGERASFHKEYKDWYLLSGLLPIWRTNMAELIAKERLAEVRVQTEDRLEDGIITLITEELLLGLFPQTIVIEGNTVSPRHIVIEDTTPRPGPVTPHAEPSGSPGGQPPVPPLPVTGRPASGAPVNAPAP